MDNTAALKALLAKVVAGDAQQDDFTAAFPYEWPRHALRAYHDNSLDAALALHRAVLPDWVFTLAPEHFQPDPGDAPTNDVKTNWARVYSRNPPYGASGDAKTPARAWLIAIINGLIAKNT